MQKMIRRAVLLVLLVPLLVACGSRNNKQDPSPRAQLHELFPPKTSAAPATAKPAPATQPRAAAPGSSAAGATAWPVTITAQNVTFEVHEPLADAWVDGVLIARSLVLAAPAGQQKSVPGSVLMKAATQVDAATGLVTLRDLAVMDASFPDAPDKGAAWHEVLRPLLPERIKTVGLARLEAGKTIVQARERASSVAVPVPRILISEKPAVLVYIDGEPRYVPLKQTQWMGVVNTTVLLLKDSSGALYLHLYDGWVSAAALQGPWKIAPTPPGIAGLEQAARATGRVNLLPGKPDAAGRTPTLAEPLPQIVVSTQPAALIVLDGAPRFSRIPATDLEYATNTSAHLFRVESNNQYVRVAGYWFRAGSLHGPWEHVRLASLPAGFSAIPDNSPKRGVKAAIAQTQAPTTASASAIVAADPMSARLAVTLSGDPVLQPITGTQLNYVANASVPIIQVDIDNWYAVQNAVWFHSTAATGPWAVTNYVPPEIYAIPPTAPIYHAIHSRVFASSTDATYYDYPTVGSLPGEGGATGVEDQGSDYQYTPPSSLHWGWFY
jgi:hypothetical protein